MECIAPVIAGIAKRHNAFLASTFLDHVATDLC
jgi:hypothetical protein